MIMISGFLLFSRVVRDRGGRLTRKLDIDGAGPSA